MNFLDICNDIKRESQQVAGVEMTDVTGYSGILGQIPRWANKAYRDVLNLNRGRWDFLKVFNHSFNLSPDKRDYSLAYLELETLSEWELNHASIYETAKGVVDESLLTPISVADWQKYYRRGTQQTAKPTLVMEYPDGTLSFHAIPDREYTVTGVNYWYAPADMSGKNDIPAIPEAHHEIIVQRALMKYATFDDAPDVYLSAGVRYKELLNEMEDDYLPDPVLSWSPIA